MKLFETEVQTETEKLDAIVDTIKSKAIRSLSRFQREQVQIFNMIWNSYENTPQEILDKFGTDAVELFIASKNAEDYLTLVLGDRYTPLVVPYEFTINEDGSVTVGDKIETEEIIEEPPMPVEENVEE